ncbi:acyl-CoA Delta(11) desaturase-like [Leguminivora glycinivorella]|uniref:acyl-CoA Delta(11) desaturase-like n=1 Tax=Leguminivora glycinivorella TaxID=1035111 RepID=UPI00200FDADB|nr:acyl-CoA Delta(11) desaturase-like [Leguminivora glycinivorella]
MPPRDSQTVPLRSHEKPAASLPPRKYEIIYLNVFLHAGAFISSIYGLYLCFTSAQWKTIAFAYSWYVMGILGVTAGTHRLWSHRSYKAKPPLQVLLMLFNSIAFQNTAIDWVRNHRLHHKHSDTDADPHNSQRGILFSHIGWLCVRKHPDVKEFGKTTDMSDIYSNAVLRFQKKHKVPLFGAMCFGLPTLIPLLWGESIITSWHVNLLRFVADLNSILLVNSIAHKYGNRPYDKSICSRQNGTCNIWTLGEGYHNFHHTFPWDYRSAELGTNCLNFTKWFIDFFALIGWAYDLKTVPDDMIQRRMTRTGDGSKPWGWGDKDMTKEERESATIIYPDKSEKEDDVTKKIDITRIFSHDYFRLFDEL